MQQSPSCPAGLQNREVSSWCSDVATSGMLWACTSLPVSQGRSFPVGREELCPQGQPAPPPLGCWGPAPSLLGSRASLAFSCHSSSSCPLPLTRASRRATALARPQIPPLSQKLQGRAEHRVHRTGPGRARCHQPGSGARVCQAAHSHLSTLRGWAGGPLPAASLPGAGLCPNRGSPAAGSRALLRTQCPGIQGHGAEGQMGAGLGPSPAARPCSRPAQGSTAQSLLLASSCPERSQSCAAGAAVPSITQPGWATRTVAPAPGTLWVAGHSGGATAAVAVTSHTPVPLLPGPSGLPQCRPSSGLRRMRPRSRTWPMRPLCL